MPAETELVEVAEPPLTRAAQTVRQEVAVVMAEDDVGNDLRFGRILFDLAPRAEAVVRAHPREQFVKAGRPKPRPLAAAEQDVPRDDQDILARAHALSLAMDAADGVSRDARDGRPCRWAWPVASALGSAWASDLAWPARRR